MQHSKHAHAAHAAHAAHTYSAAEVAYAPAADENPFLALLDRPLAAAPAPERHAFSELLSQPLAAKPAAPESEAPALLPQTERRSRRSRRICGCGKPNCHVPGSDGYGFIYTRE